MTEDQPFSPTPFPETPFGKRVVMPDVKADPAPHPLEVHREKLTTMVSNIGLTTLDGFRALRDETDEVMRTIAEQQDHVQQQIEKLAEDCRAGLDTVKVVREFFTKLKEQHRVSLPRAASLKLEGDAQ